MSKTLLLALTLLGLAFPAAGAQTLPSASTKTAIFAGGCFWCMQPPYDHAKGVIKTIVGYTGGKESDANYRRLRSQDKAPRINRGDLRSGANFLRSAARYFLAEINPTQADGQFHDIGLSYQAAIYYGNDGRERESPNVKGEPWQIRQISETDRDGNIAGGEILPGGRVSPEILPKEQSRLRSLPCGSGRVAYLEKIWGKEAKP